MRQPTVMWRCFIVRSYVQTQNFIPVKASSADRTPFGDLRRTTSTTMSEFRRSTWDAKRRSRTLRIRVESQIKSLVRY